MFLLLQGSAKERPTEDLSQTDQCAMNRLIISQVQYAEISTGLSLVVLLKSHSGRCILHK